MHEFDVIARFFSWEKLSNNIDVGVGDDAAVLNLPENQQLVTSIDTLISGVHFPENTPADAIGHKALAVNLSDLAAMGAKPAWFTLALTLPAIDESWLEQFSTGLQALADQHGIALVGGDTTRGPLSISIQVMGFVKTGTAMLRFTAKPTDKIYVTGTLGDAAAGLQTILADLDLSKDDKHSCQQRLNYPQPRLSQSNSIKSFASACIDVSDGLLQDLSHILKASKLGAEINLAQLPLSPALLTLDKSQAVNFALTGGDDYELLFTIPAKEESQFLETLKSQDNKTVVTCIGILNDKSNRIVDENQNDLTVIGYKHFEA